MTWTDEGQDNRVHKDAVETIEKVIKSAKTILADEFAIQQMEYDELYGVNSKEYIAYQNLVTNYLNHRGLLADLDAGKLMASGTGTARPPSALPHAPLPLSSDPSLPVAAPAPAPAAPVGFPAQSMAMFDLQVEGFNDSIFESSGARSSLEFNPNATPPPEEERVSELPIPPDAEVPFHLSAPTASSDYDPEFLPLEASIQVDEQVANAAAMIASAEPDPSYASGSWSIPSQIQAPLPSVPPGQAPAPQTDPYASGSWAALSHPSPQQLEEPGHVQQFAQPQLQGAAPSPWAPIAPSPVEQSAPVPSPFQAPAAAPAPDYNPWNPLPGTSQGAPSVEAFASAPLPQQQQSPYATDASNDKWETGGWATITPQQTAPNNGVVGGAQSGGTGSAFVAPPAVDSASQWAPPESHYQAQHYQTSTEEEEKKDDKSAFTFDPTKAWE